MANHTILIIDYEPRNVEAASHPLEKAGYKVATAADGVAGMKAFERLNPSLVLIEAMLPKKHGFEVCQEIKKTTHGKRTPVVITTAVYRGRKYRTQALHIYGADEYLEKPFTGDQILEVCFRFLGEPPGVAPEADESQRRIAVNEGAVEPQMASAPAATPAPPPTQSTGAFSKIVGDLTEDEITARLDAILPGELTDLSDEGVIAEDPAPALPDPTDEMPAGLTVVDDLPPEIGDTFIAVDPPTTESPVEPPPMIETEPEPPQHEEIAVAADVVPELPPEQPAEEPAEEQPEETPEPAAEKKTAEQELDEVAEESDDPPKAAEVKASSGRKRRRKSKKKKRVTRAESSKLAAEDRAAEAEPASAPTPEATTEAPELEAAAEPQTETPPPVKEDVTEPQAEETATEESVDKPRDEMDELADVVSAAIDQMQVFDEPEAEEPSADEPAATEAASVEPAVEEPVAEEPSAEVAAEQEAAAETATLEEVSTQAPTEPTPGRKTGLWIGVAAAVFIGLAVTMFFVFQNGTEGTNTAGTMPEVTPAPLKVRTTPPSSPARNESSANAAVTLGPGAGSSVPEPATTVKAAAPTAKPEPPVVQPTPPPETETTTAEVESEPVVPATDEMTEEPTPASDDAATKIEEVETLAPAVIVPMIEGTTAGSVPATVTDSESVNLDPEPAVETTTQVEASLPEPAAEILEEAEPAIENERIVEEPTPVPPPPAPKAVTGNLVPLYKVDQQPSPLDQPRPLYPTSARRLRQEGTVILNVLIDENGRVTEVEMIRGVSEELDGAAVRAVKGWSYKPARKDGVYVKVWKPEKVVFKL
jgi:TonB family protein